MTKGTGTSFKSVAQMFIAFKDETDLNIGQVQIMTYMASLLNASDPEGKLNGGEDYKLAIQIDESDSNPFYEVDLPDVPNNPLPRANSKKSTPVKEGREDVCIAEITLGSSNISIFTNSFSFMESEGIAIGGRIDFKEDELMSKKLEWAENHLR